MHQAPTLSDIRASEALVCICGNEGELRFTACGTNAESNNLASEAECRAAAGRTHCRVLILQASGGHLPCKEARRVRQQVYAEQDAHQSGCHLRCLSRITRRLAAPHILPHSFNHCGIIHHQSWQCQLHAFGYPIIRASVVDHSGCIPWKLF